MPKPNLYRLQKDFSKFTTENVLCFSDNTYFLVSMTTNDSGSVKEFLLYPGGAATFRENQNIPEKFRDPLKVHPDLQINIRRKAHRVDVATSVFI